MFPWPAFLSYILLSAFTPGPNNIMSMSTATQRGLRKSLTFCVGVLLGVFIVITLCTFGSVTLYELIPRVEPIMKCLGAAYILWLAWTVWRDRPHQAQQTEEKHNLLCSGMLLQLVNPKSILYGMTALSTFILPHYHDPVAIGLFNLLLCAVGFAGTVCWALFGFAFQKLFERHRTLINGIMALLLIYSAAMLFM